MYSVNKVVLEYIYSALVGFLRNMKTKEMTKFSINDCCSLQPSAEIHVDLRVDSPLFFNDLYQNRNAPTNVSETPQYLNF